MKVVVIGTGYVGLVQGACLSELGHKVYCVDNDKTKIEKLINCEIPIYEPGLKEIVEKNQNNGNLHFLSSLKAALDKNPEIVFVAVGTPSSENGDADLSYLNSAVDEFADNVVGSPILVIKSTVPVGTTQRISDKMKYRFGSKIKVVNNPEFLKEGTAVYDFFNSDRIVIGTDCDYARGKMEELYAKLLRKDELYGNISQSTILFTDSNTSEMIKYASNTFLAMKISFINEISRILEVIDGDVSVVASGIGLDTRIGDKFLRAGCGYGGSCFPKDVKALAHLVKELQIKAPILSSIDKSNDYQKLVVPEFIKRFIITHSGYKNCNIGILGLTFKPETDDIRYTPVIEMVENLNGSHNLYLNDPEGMSNFDKLGYGNCHYTTVDEIFSKCAIIIIATEWKSYLELPAEKFHHKVVVDARNCRLDLKDNPHIIYKGIGV